MEIDYNAIGYRIRKVRCQKGLTQEQLAELCDLSSVYIGYVENAKRQVGLTSLTSIANALNTGLDYLICGENICENMNSVLQGCTETQKQIIFLIAESVKNILNEKNI